MTSVMIFFHCSILVTIVPLQLSFSLWTFTCIALLFTLDCPRSGQGQVQGIFSGPEPGPPGLVQPLTGPGPGPHWTGSTRVGPGPGQVWTWTWLFFFSQLTYIYISFKDTAMSVIHIVALLSLSLFAFIPHLCVVVVVAGTLNQQNNYS